MPSVMRNATPSEAPIPIVAVFTWGCACRDVEFEVQFAVGVMVGRVVFENVGVAVAEEDEEEEDRETGRISCPIVTTFAEPQQSPVPSAL
jgi:hypothetical protein